MARLLSAWRIVSPTTSSRLSARTAARTCVESVRCRPRDVTELLLPTPTEQGIEQERFCAARNQACAELRQDRGIEAGIGQFEAQDVFPVDPAAHGICSRAISESLGELEDRDEGEPPRREGGLAMRREERGKGRVGEEGAEFIGETEIRDALSGTPHGRCGRSRPGQDRRAADGAWRSPLLSGDG